MLNFCPLTHNSFEWDIYFNPTGARDPIWSFGPVVFLPYTALNFPSPCWALTGSCSFKSKKTYLNEGAEGRSMRQSSQRVWFFRTVHSKSWVPEAYTKPGCPLCLSEVEKKKSDSGKCDCEVLKSRCVGGPLWWQGRNKLWDPYRTTLIWSSFALMILETLANREAKEVWHFCFGLLPLLGHSDFQWCPKPRMPWYPTFLLVGFLGLLP